MQNRIVGTIIGLLVAVTVFASAAMAQAGQRGAAPRGNAAAAAPSPAHDPHDLTGVWLAGGGGGGGAAGGPPAVTQWSRTAPQFTPQGLAKMNANKSGKGPRAVMPALGNDPLGDANPPGLMRTLIYNRPFQIVQTPDAVVQLFEWGHFWRNMWTDGRKMPEDIAPLFYGYSVAKWEGDTLVVNTAGLDSRVWLDEWGTPFSDDVRVEERWHRVNRDNLELTLTITDPQTYVKPWVSDKKNFRLQAKGTPDGELLEVIFAPMDEQEFNRRIRNPAAGVPNK